MPKRFRNGPNKNLKWYGLLLVDHTSSNSTNFMWSILEYFDSLFCFFKDLTGRSNNTPAYKKALTKVMNMGIRVVGTSNQLFIRGSETETKLSKK